MAFRIYLINDRVVVIGRPPINKPFRAIPYSQNLQDVLKWSEVSLVMEDTSVSH